MEGRVANPLLAYYQRWAAGPLKRQLKAKQMALEETKVAELDQAATVEDLLHRIRNHQSERCPDMISLAENPLGLVDSATDADGVQHTLLATEQGRLQFVAERRGEIIFADPKLCPKYLPKLIEHSADNNSVTIDLDPLKKAGGEELLDKNDQSVQDAVDLFKRVAAENCNGLSFDKVEVISASERIVDGLDIMLILRVNGKEHFVQCEFEVSANHTDASLLAVGSRSMDSHSPFPGAIAKIVMNNTNICDAGKESSLSPEERKTVLLMQHRRMGELSRYKGYEHINDDLPELVGISMLSTKELPWAYSLLDTHPHCFPDGGKEVIRNQGTCGSCWAFASASSVMANLCISSSTSALASSADRFEVSVQNIMSCNSDSNGCEGGFASSTHSAFKAAGIAKERDNPYKCGGGDPKNHFDAHGGCTSAPWGGECKSWLGVDDWNFFGASKISGEPDMMTIISSGNSLYMSLDVYENFIDFKGDGVVTTLGGSKKGGHAVTGVGYGWKNGVKYWLLQNSWGHDWGVNGYGKALRGTNFAGLEEDSFFMRAWVNGGAEPPCYDAALTGFTMGGVGVPCTDAKKYGDWCEDGSSVKDNCPVTCGRCSGSSPLPGGRSAPAQKHGYSGCIQDVTHQYSGYECVYKNACDYTVKFKCPSQGCTHVVSGSSSAKISNCGGQRVTDICKGGCRVWAE